MKSYSLESQDAADADIEAAFYWYQAEEPGLGLQFLSEVRAAYRRILHSPLSYQEVWSGARRALTRRFPYAVYFTVEAETIFVIAVIHTARDPAEWQWRSDYKQP